MRIICIKEVRREDWLTLGDSYNFIFDDDRYYVLDNYNDRLYFTEFEFKHYFMSQQECRKIKLLKLNEKG